MNFSEVIENELKTGYKRTLSHICRNPYSNCAGSCDQGYWRWRNRDFSNASLQYAGVPLLKLVLLDPPWLTVEAKDHCLETALMAARYLAEIQHRNGSFDQCYPYENHPGVVYDAIPLWVLLLERFDSDLDSETRTRIRSSLEKAMSYALRNDERYADIANHFAHFAYTLFNYSDLMDSASAKNKAFYYLERLEGVWSSEGWFAEYGGPDIGYQTRCLAYLARIDDLGYLDDSWIEKIEKALAFVERFAFPDDSFAGAFGSRNTRMCYLFGLIYWASKSERAKRLSAFQAKRLQKGIGFKASEVDFDNGILYLDDLVDSVYELERQNVEFDGEGACLSEEEQVLETLPEAGFLFNRSDVMYIVVHLKKGGIWKALDFQYPATGGFDWGMVLREGEHVYTNAVRQDPVSLKIENCRIEAVYQFFECEYETLTPVKMILLRCLNMTLWRFQWLGDMGKALVAKRLFAKRKSIGVYCDREYIFEPGGFVCRTCIRWSGGGMKRFVPVGEFASHTMASAGYFEESNLLGKPFGVCIEGESPLQFESRFYVGGNGEDTAISCSS